MPAEVILPFNERDHLLGSLRSISSNGRLTIFAVNSNGTYISLNFNDLLPGDVLLFKSPPGAMAGYEARATRLYQRRILNNPDAQTWEHVGILDGNLQAWDAMPSLHVRRRVFAEVLREAAVLAVVRPRRAIDPARLDQSLLDLSLGQYRFFQRDTGGLLAYRFAHRLTGISPVPRQPDDGAVICSSFASHVLRRATGHGFFSTLAVEVPGDFVEDPEFERVELNWCHVNA